MIQEDENGRRLVRSVNGINNVTDPYRLGHDWLKAAVNVDITNTGAIVRRGEAVQALTTQIDSVFKTGDGRVFIMAAGTLKRIMPDLTVRTLASGYTEGDYSWGELNNQVYFGDGVSYGMIGRDDSVSDLAWEIPLSPTLSTHGGNLPAGTYRCCCTFVMPDGRETGASEETEIELDGTTGLLISDIPQESGWATNVYLTAANSTVFMLAVYTSSTVIDWNLDPSFLNEPLETQEDYPIRGENLTFWKGQLFTTELGDGVTTIWASEPLQPHLFPLGDSHLSLPGEVTVLGDAGEALLVCTREKTYRYDGETVTEVADYGAPKGTPGKGSDGLLYFMTNEGLCRAFPFENLTKGVYSFTLAEGLRTNVLEHRDELRIITTGG